MFKDKRLLTGLGAGLMLGAMLLQLMLFATTGPGSDGVLPGSRELDADQLRQEAEQLGFVVHDAGEQWYSRAEVDNLIQEALAEAAGSGAQGETAQQPSAGEAEPDGADVAVIDNEALAHFYLVEIRAGMASDEVGDMLHAAGLVDDPAAYREAMAQRGLTVKIRAGTYTFAYKPELETLIDAITLPSN